MTLYNRRSIRAAGTTVFLPPFGSPQPDLRPVRVSNVQPVPFTNRSVSINNRLHGYTLDVSFRVYEDSVEAALDFQGMIDDALQDGSGLARSVDFCFWYDTDGTRTKILRNGEVTDGPHWGEAESERFRTCSFTLFFKNSTFYTTFSDGSTPSTASTYEEYLAGPTPDGEEPEATPVPIAQNPQLGGTFHGVAEVTAHARGQKVHRLIVGSATGLIKGIGITGCSAAGTGTTTIKVSNAAFDGGGSVITATVAAGATYGSFTSGSIGPLAAGSAIYVFITGANGHADVDYQIATESA